MSVPHASAIYEGVVRHRRRAPVVNRFRYGLYLSYLDLAELPLLLDGHPLASTRRPAPIRFRRRDYLGDPQKPLDQAVRDLVEQRLGRRPGGPIRLLTHLRALGHGFNPVSFYYCFEGDGERLAAIVAEVTNTPWKESHCYVLEPQPGAKRMVFELDKAFHVSPFMGMEQRYRWTLTAPGRRLLVHMESFENGVPLFDATLLLRRRPWSRGRLAANLLRYPAMTVAVVLWIHWQALRLWWRRTPFHPHPTRFPEAADARTERPSP